MSFRDSLPTPVRVLQDPEGAGVLDPHDYPRYPGVDTPDLTLLKNFLGNTDCIPGSLGTDFCLFSAFARLTNGPTGFDCLPGDNEGGDCGGDGSDDRPGIRRCIHEPMFARGLRVPWLMAHCSLLARDSRNSRTKTSVDLSEECLGDLPARSVNVPRIAC
jgi:hypothetical protein